MERIKKVDPDLEADLQCSFTKADGKTGEDNV